MSVSKSYKAMLVEMHGKTKWGTSGDRWSGHVQARIVASQAKTVLDYGCGHGTMKRSLQRALPKLDVREFDPGIVGKDSPPEPADLVTCTDVLEHVEPDMLDETLDALVALARRELFLVVSCRPANAVLPDGRNAHLIVEAPRWWLSQLERVCDGWTIILHAPIESDSKTLAVSMVRGGKGD